MRGEVSKPTETDLSAASKEKSAGQNNNCNNVSHPAQLTLPKLPFNPPLTCGCEQPDKGAGHEPNQLQTALSLKALTAPDHCRIVVGGGTTTAATTTTEDAACTPPA